MTDFEAPVPVCQACSEDFDVEASPDVERCQRCAEDHQWREGAGLANHASIGRITQDV